MHTAFGPPLPDFFMRYCITPANAYLEIMVSLPARPGFPTTLWSVVAGVCAKDADTALGALERLARAYWQPLHGFLRQRGVPEDAAADCVQGFFAHLISKEILFSVERRETRFRSFLLTCFTRWLSNQRRDAATQRRGGGAEHLPVEELDRSGQLCVGDTPEQIYEQRWARALYDHALARLEAEIAVREERREFFQELKRRVLHGAQVPPDWEGLARQHGMNAATVRKAAHDLRQRLATLLRHEVRKVVAQDDEVDDELRHLLRLLAG